jgi:hypothetical protein
MYLSSLAGRHGEFPSSGFPARPERPRAVQDRAARYRHAGAEPRLEDVFEDAIIRAVMRRDGVSDAMLRRVVACTQQRLGLAPSSSLDSAETRP